MSNKEGRASRRGFLTGMLAGVGAAAAALTATGRHAAAESAAPQPQQGPILYRRTAEAERYYKTLYR